MSENARIRPELAERWSLPQVDGPIVGMGRESPTRERARLAEATRATEAARQAELDRGYEAGMAAGRAQLQSQVDALTVKVARLDEILTALSRPLPDLESEVEQQLVLLALAVGKQLARRELRADRIDVFARIRVHPEDAAAVCERLATAGQERAWSVVEDPTLTRGGCLVRSENSQIDARIESRVNALVSGMLGEERARARLDESPPPGAES